MAQRDDPLDARRASDAPAMSCQLQCCGLLSRTLDPSVVELRTRLRHALGLQARFIAGAGHQPTAWHAGLLAKFVAASNVARLMGPSACWVHFLSDQDVGDPLRIDLPTRDGAGRVRKQSLHLAAPSASLAAGAIACARAALDVRAPTGVMLASRQATDALERTVDSLTKSRNCPTAALQMARANELCASGWIDRSAAIITSASLLTNEAIAPIVNCILDSPEECAKRFNSALRIDQRAARPLREAGSDSEVPLWGVRSDGCRERLSATEARRRLSDGCVVLPRAFLASGIMRLVCDVFFHGTGGARYERVGEMWWRDFLGIALPDFAVATATILPSMKDLGISIDQQQPGGLTWREAWWDPTRLASDGATKRMIEPVRAAFLQRIADAPRRSMERNRAYRELCSHIDSQRSARRSALDALEAHDRSNRVLLDQGLLAQDRTWPFALLAKSQLDAMSAQLLEQLNWQRTAPVMPTPITLHTD